MSSNLGRADGSTPRLPPQVNPVGRDRWIVALIPYSRPVTGGVQADLRIVEQLGGRGWRVLPVYFADEPADLAGRGRRAHLQFNLRLFRHLRRLPPDCILLEDEALSNTLLLFNWWARLRAGARVVLITHHLSFKLWRHPVRRLYWRLAEGWAARHADLVLSDSDSTRQDLLALGVHSGRVRVIPLAAESSWSRKSRSPTDAGPLRLLSVGTVEPRKGLEYLLQALGRVPRHDWQLDVVGELEPRYFGSLSTLVTSLGLRDRVRFHGRLSNETLETIVSHADVFVHPAVWEGFGIAVLEAMQAGLPVVASSAGALGELIEDGVTGLLVPPGDIQALATALARVLGDPQLRERLAHAARESVRDRYSWDRAGSLIDQALASLD